MESVLLADVESQSIEEFKSLLDRIIGEDYQAHKNENIEAYILLISKSVSKAMKVAAERSVVDEFPVYILPVLIGIEDETYYHYEKTGFLKSASTIYHMESHAEEYFKIQE